MAFRGQYKYTLDAKNRLFIPAKYRDKLGEEFVLFKGPEKCLYAYDTETFEEVSVQFMEGYNRTVQRSFFSQVADVTYDKQGRVTLSADQVEHAELVKDIMIIGAGDRIEIWSLENFEKATLSVAELCVSADYHF